MDDLARVSLRMSASLRLTLERLADREHRNLNSQIVHILEDWLTEKGVPREAA